MKNAHRKPAGRSLRLIVFSLGASALLLWPGFWSGTHVAANHPVLVEGNCDSPVPGATIVAAGKCGDYDGDGLLGTAEDADGTDRVFGTLNAALGAVDLGTTINPTTANFNGRIIVVTSGRFAETLYIGNNSPDPSVGSRNPGHVTIEAAPGVQADIDAVLQGDPAGLNNTRQGQPGIRINYTSSFPNRIVTLRNLTIRNYLIGVHITGVSRVIIDNCRFENNLRSNLAAGDSSDVVVANSLIESAGFRIGTAPSTGAGRGVEVGNAAKVRLMETTISNNKGAGIYNTAPAANVVLFKVSAYFNKPNILGVVTTSSNPNYSF
jgi:hypothetical protein